MPHFPDSDDDNNSSSRKLVLDRSNFIVWKQRTANAARGKGLYLYLTGEEPCPRPTLSRNDRGEQLPLSDSEQKELRLWKKEDNRAIALLTDRLPDHLLQKHCRDGMTSAEMWSAIITAHEKTGLHSEMLALNPILQRYQDGDDMEAFIAQKRNAQQKLSALGVSFHDRLLALLLLHSMPESFAAAKSTLTHLHRDTFTFESVADALVSEYILRQAATAASSEHGGEGENAMYAVGNLGSERTNNKNNKAAAKIADRNSKCTKKHCTERNHGKETCWARIGYPIGHRLHKAAGGADSQQQRPTTGNAKQAYVASDNFDSDDESVLFVSEARLHSADEAAMFPYLVTHRLSKAPGGAEQQQQQRPNTGSTKQAYVVNDNFDLDDESARFVSEARHHTADEVAMFSSSPPSNDTSIWCVDSGASHHYCNDRALFRNLEPTTDKELSMANGATSDIIGCGSINTDFPVLTNHPHVRCVPALRYNLLSVSEMSKGGWRVDFTDDVCHIRSQDGKTIVSTAIRSGGMYRIPVKGRNAALTKAAEIANAAADKATADKAINNKAVLPTPPQASEEAMLWHERTGHLHGAGLPTWAAKRTAEDGPNPVTHKTIESCDARWHERVNGLSDSAGAGGEEMRMRTRIRSVPSRWLGPSPADRASVEPIEPTLIKAMRTAARPTDEVQCPVQHPHADIDHANHHDADEAQPARPNEPAPSSHSSHVQRDNDHHSVSSERPRRTARQHTSSQSRVVEDAEHDQCPLDSQPLSTLISSAAAVSSIPPSAAALFTSDDWNDRVALLIKTVLDDDPRNYNEAVRRLDSASWHSAMQTEYESLMKNHTWGEPVEPPPGANLIGCGCVDKTKRGKDGSITKHRARLVVSGNRQQYSIETAPIRDRANRNLTIRQGAYTRALIHWHEVGHYNTAAHPIFEGAKLKQFDGQATDSAIRKYQSILGGIIWAAVCTRPDIALAAARLSQYANNLSKARRQAVSCRTKRRHTVTLSSVEAEYRAAVQAAKDAICWRRFLTAVGHDITDPTILRSDSQGSTQLTKNEGSGHDRTKHVETWHHFLTELTERRMIKMHPVGTADMAADTHEWTGETRARGRKKDVGNGV
jgi:hypothetical protein